MKVTTHIRDFKTLYLRRQLDEANYLQATMKFCKKNHEISVLLVSLNTSKINGNHKIVICNTIKARISKLFHVLIQIRTHKTAHANLKFKRTEIKGIVMLVK